MAPDSPHVESFVLRFVSDASESDVPLSHARASQESSSGAALPSRQERVTARGWRGIVVHIQSNAERTFTHFADAVAFIARYVPLGDVSFRRMKDEVSPAASSALARRDLNGARRGARAWGVS